MEASKALIFSDLDGTLLDHFTYEFSAATPMLEKLSKENVPVILNTSKTVTEVEHIRYLLGLKTPFIVENGAAVYIPINTFAEQPKGTLLRGDYWIKTFCEPSAHWLSILAESTPEYASYYQGFSTLSVAQLSGLTGLSIDEAKRAKKREYGEPVHWIGDEELKQNFIENLINSGANVVHGGRFIHIGGFCDKGQAMIWLAEQYRTEGFDSSILTIALGDGENDTAMLEAADIAVQIRSPVHDFPVLSRQYNHIQTELYGPEGWASAIQQLLF